MADVAMDTIVKIVGPIAGVLVTVISLWRQRRSEILPRSPISRLRNDLEILRSLKETDHPDLEPVQRHVDMMIEKVYEQPFTQKSFKLRRPNEPKLFIMGVISAVVFSLATWYLVRDNFSWWAIGTGFGILTGIMWIGLSYRIMELGLPVSGVKSVPRRKGDRRIIPRERIEEKREELIKSMGLPEDTIISKIADTHTMDPWIDYGCNLFLVPLPKDYSPYRYDDLAIGDVAVYRIANAGFLHQIIEIGKDDQGRYFRFKGISATRADPYVVRDQDIKHLMVAVCY